MPKEITLYIEKKFSAKINFYKLMNTLLNTQSFSIKDALIINFIFHMQILSAFYSKQINIFKPEKYFSDNILYIIESIIRIKDLLIDNYSGLEIVNIIILVLMIIFFFDILIVIYKGCIYNEYNLKYLNFFIKIFLFFLYNVSLDVSFSQLCFSTSKINPNFISNIKCFGKNKVFIIIPILTIIFGFCLNKLLIIYYQDNFFLSNSCFAKLFTNYDIYISINCFFNSILLTQAYFVTKEFFLIYNFIFSFFILFYYIKNYIYYNTYINLTSGIFHFIYFWTSLFSLFAAYIDFKDKGIAYILSCIIIGFIYYYIKKKIEKNIFYDISINNIKNINYLLIYIKTLTDLLIKYDRSVEKRSFISGLIKLLIKEFNNNNFEFNKQIMYIPLNNTFRNEKLSNIKDEVFLKYFIIFIYSYILSIKKINIEIYLNLSHYYLLVIGNYCEAMNYCQKLLEYNLNYQQDFAFFRLKSQIEHGLNKKLKYSNEINVSLENLNVSVYFQYENLSDKFLKEIYNDIELSLKFWNIFKKMYLNPKFKLNFNKVYKLSENIQKTKKNIDKMWKALMKEYSGINEYFEFYNEYIEQINDDELKKREFDSLKKKMKNLNENINSNYYSILFNKNTGIILVSKDKGSEGIIKTWNKKIETIFKFTDLDLKEKNINILMPKMIEKNHDKYMENYFETGYNKYIETKDFKTYGKDKNNSIIQIKIAAKLFPILNYNIIFAGLIIKEDLNDAVLVDENFIIQGMCSDLRTILNVKDDYLFQNNDIPFYVICKKFINFYKTLIKNKDKDTSINEIFNKNTNSAANEKGVSSKRKREKDNEENNLFKKDDINDQIQENFEINENFELEFEIKIPQFIINYSNKIKNKKNQKKKSIEKDYKIENLSQESLEDEEIDDEENELLLSNISKKKHIKNKYITPEGTPKPESPFSINLTPLNLRNETTTTNNNFSNQEKNINKSEEEKIFVERMEKMINYFKEERFDELESLISLYNNESKILEYKFNFTFDKYKYGNNEIGYIIRCIEQKKLEGQADEKSFELDSKEIKFLKKREEAIKPLYEILPEEREEIIKYPDKFFKFLENKKFQEIIESSKNELLKMSKIQGHHKNEILHRDNSSSLSSHSGFDSDLIVKNKIGELRSNLFQTIPNFFTIKYLKIVVISISISTFLYSLIYLIFIFNSFSDLKNVSLMDLKLYKASLKTIELVEIIISLKAIIMNKSGDKYYTYLNYVTDDIKSINDYYNYMINLSHIIYHDLNNEYGYLNMHMSEYLSGDNLLNLYWNYINISYNNDLYKKINTIGTDLFPAAIMQFLCNANIFLNSNNYNNISDERERIVLYNEAYKKYFEYYTFLIIENSYINIIPDLFNKIEKIPDIYSNYNNNKKNYVYLIIFVYIGVQIIICVLYFSLIRLTSLSMSDILKKLTKIKLEKIEETLKKIEKFFINLKLFREKSATEFEEENENKEEIKEEKHNKKREQNISRKNSSIFNNSHDISFFQNDSFSEKDKYEPLTILFPYFSHCLIFTILIGCFITPIYIYSIDITKAINQLLLIINFIYGKLMNTSSDILKLKCYITECNINNYTLHFENLGTNDDIQNFVKGIRNFKEIENFYKNKFMLNACDAAIDKEKNLDKYYFCTNDTMIDNSNNTDNMMRLISNYIDNIYRKDEMDQIKDNNYFRQKMFSGHRYQMVEHLYFNYVISVDQIFENTVLRSLNDYIKTNKYILIILIIAFCLLMVFYNLIYLIILTPKLIYLISIARGVLTIIPTSVIMNTPELKALIGNKY